MRSLKTRPVPYLKLGQAKNSLDREMSMILFAISLPMNGQDIHMGQNSCLYKHQLGLSLKDKQSFEETQIYEKISVGCAFCYKMNFFMSRKPEGISPRALSPMVHKEGNTVP
jgi:hypothetical protein